jgi:glutathione S-transferase
MLKLYDLAGRNPELRFSPFCWRTKMALRHKGLAFESVPWRFTDKAAIAPSGQGRVPVLVDNGRWLHDSWRIALYLDDHYPDLPRLFRSAGERAAARFIADWCDLALLPVLRPLILLACYDAVADQDRRYFRESREKMLGRSLEAVCAERTEAEQALARVLTPMENTLGAVAHLGGDSPNYADYILFGSLQWAHVISPKPVLDQASAVSRWFERMLGLFDGYAREAPTLRETMLVTAERNLQAR